MAHVTTRNYLIDRAPGRIVLLGDKQRGRNRLRTSSNFPAVLLNFPAPAAAIIGLTSSSIETSRYPAKSKGFEGRSARLSTRGWTTRSLRARTSYPCPTRQNCGKSRF